MEELASSPVKISASKAPITCDRVSPKQLKEGQYCEGRNDRANMDCSGTCKICCKGKKTKCFKTKLCQS